MQLLKINPTFCTMGYTLSVAMVLAILGYILAHFDRPNIYIIINHSRFFLLSILANQKKNAFLCSNGKMFEKRRKKKKNPNKKAAKFQPNA
jgi:hypothetical protein